jgi:hypothetical protein
MVEPGLRQQCPWRHQRNARLKPEPLCGAAPGPVLDLADEAPGHRPTFDHDAAPDHVAAPDERGDGYGHRVFSGVRRRRAPGSPYPFDQGAERVRSPRRDHEIPGVRQQTEGQQLYVVRAQQAPQVLERSSVLACSTQLRLRSHQATGDVKVANGGTCIWHRKVSSTSGRGKRSARWR